MTGPMQIEVAGCRWDVTETCPHEVMSCLEDEHDVKLLTEWAQEEGREQLRPYPWLAPAQQLLRRKLSKAWTKRHRSIVKIAITGCLPQQMELYDQCRVDDMRCPLCNEEEGTNQHVYWRCQHEECVAARKKLAQPPNSPSSQTSLGLSGEGWRLLRMNGSGAGAS